MLANKDEAVKCLELARKWDIQNRPAKSYKFAQKSLKLFPTFEARMFIQELLSKNPHLLESPLHTQFQSELANINIPQINNNNANNNNHLLKNYKNTNITQNTQNNQTKDEYKKEEKNNDNFQSSSQNIENPNQKTKIGNENNNNNYGNSQNQNHDKEEQKENMNENNESNENNNHSNHRPNTSYSQVFNNDNDSNILRNRRHYQRGNLLSNNSNHETTYVNPSFLNQQNHRQSQSQSQNNNSHNNNSNNSTYQSQENNNGNNNNEEPIIIDNPLNAMNENSDIIDRMSDKIDEIINILKNKFGWILGNYSIPRQYQQTLFILYFIFFTLLFFRFVILQSPIDLFGWNSYQNTHYNQIPKHSYNPNSRTNTIQTQDE